MKKLLTYHLRGVKIDGFTVKKHPNYSSWTSMKSRLKPNASCYENYAGRNIDTDPRWLYFANFCADLGIRPSLDYTLERINNDLGYWPCNCKWANRTEQCLNHRTFKISSTGCTGITRTKNKRFKIKYTKFGKSYSHSGTFESLVEAIDARVKLIDAVKTGKDLSNFSKKKVKFNSKTQIRGVSKGVKCGYIARGGHGNDRVYLGYFKTIEEAKKIVEKYEQTGN